MDRTEPSLRSVSYVVQPTSLAPPRLGRSRPTEMVNKFALSDHLARHDVQPHTTVFVHSRCQVAPQTNDQQLRRADTGWWQVRTKGPRFFRTSFKVKLPVVRKPDNCARGKRG